ncbi:MAG: TolB family protein [Gemmatimonadota bacterium]
MNFFVHHMTALSIPACFACSGGGGGSPTAPGPDPPILPNTFAGKVLFLRGPSGGLMAMNSNGSEVVSLGVRASQPDVAPDGRRVAYERDGVIFVFDLGTGAERPVSSNGLSIGPSWSPDGNQILFWSGRTGQNEVWVMDADGSNPTRLTDGGGENLEGDWSPDGSRIVFRRNTGDGGDLWVMNADGSNPEPLFGLPGQDANAQWSPDGSKIAFDHVGAEPSGAPNVDVFVIDADGSNLVRLTSDPAEDWAPNWSPDGSRIAFFHIPADHDSNIMTVGADGSGLVTLLGGPTADQNPAHGPGR